MQKSPRTWCSFAGVRLILLVLISVAALEAPENVLAQVVFTIGQPNIDSFPVVRTSVFVTKDGTPAQLVIAQNFYVLEDGVQVGAFGLSGCGGTSSVAMAVVLDTSNSMDASIGTGGISNRSYAVFYEAISRFLASIPGPSQLALVPFADSSMYSYPGPSKNYFYSSASSTDTTTFMQRLTSVSFIGKGTNVDDGIRNGAQVLLNSTLPRRIMILITDDAVKNALTIQSILESAGITLYVLEVAHDSIQTNFANKDLAIATGGAYYSAYDTSLYVPYLTAISNRIFSEHCTLRYVSNLPCPWYNTHTVQIDLSYKGNSKSATGTYTLKSNTHDAKAPTFKVDSLDLLTRTIRAADPFPCETGMKSLVDSSLSNFKRGATTVGSTLVTATLVVLDSMFSADADFIAKDSAGNISRFHVHYAPTPDIHAPQFAQPLWNGGGVLTLDIQEHLAWDRGLEFITMKSGAINLIFDSVIYLSTRNARTYFHLIRAQDPASGCVIARDSVGNTDTSCITWTGDTSDIFPPTFLQSPVSSPFTMIAGNVYENHLFDKGIRSVTVTPLFNTISPATNIISSHQWALSVGIVDSLYQASAMVEAYDSVGHYVRDTMWYRPQADVMPPVLTLVTAGGTTFDFTASDIRAWDHGIASVTVLPGATNVSAATPVFIDTRNATLTASVVDKTQNASMTVEVTDSVGHTVNATASYVGFTLLPLGPSIIDFGLVAAPLPPLITRQVSITNPNNFPITLDLSPLTGDAAYFRILTPSPVTLTANETQPLRFEFDPSLLGSWSAITTFLSGSTSMGSVTLLGRTTGQYSLALDTVSVVKEETAGVLHLSIDADPKPINLDSISFSIQYDPDVITVGNFATCPVGSLDTGVCLYATSWVGGVEGNRQGLLVRSNLSKVTTLSYGNTVLDIPFTSHLAKDSSTVVHLSATSSTLATATQTFDGLVIVGSQCATPYLRQFMQNKFIIIQVIGLAPNPSRGSLTMRLNSGVEADGQIRIISVLGAVVKEIPIHLQLGNQSLTLSDLPSTTGPYQIVVRVAGIDCARQRFELLR